MRSFCDAEPIGQTNKGILATELELKLSLDEDARHRIAKLPVVRNFASGNAFRQRLRSTYFDTPDLSLSQKGTVLRVRQQGGQWIQTVKTTNEASGGLHQRGEFESRIPDASPDYTRLVSEHDLKLFANPHLLQQMGPAFETDFWRTSWHLHLPGGSIVELCMDMGEVRKESQTVSICELELELKHGISNVLYEVALEIARSVHVRIENTSKAQSGYSLLRPSGPKPVRRVPTDVGPDMTAEDAYVSILRNCLFQMQENETVILKTDDPGGVHQMRVGLRRLRTCVSLFQNFVPDLNRRILGDDVRVFSRDLGSTRDWDVFLEDHLRPALTSLGMPDDCQNLLAVMESRRAEHYNTLRDTLVSREYHLAMLRVSAWVACRDWRKALDPKRLAKFRKPLRGVASQILSTGHQKIQRRHAALNPGDVRARHRLRISVKQQRYAAEFFQGLYPPKSLRKYGNQLSELQDLLGKLNDASLANERLSNLRNPQVPDSIASYINGWYARDAIYNQDQFPVAWEKFQRQKMFWK